MSVAIIRISILFAIAMFGMMTTLLVLNESYAAVRVGQSDKLEISGSNENLDYAKNDCERTWGLSVYPKDYQGAIKMEIIDPKGKTVNSIEKKYPFDRVMFPAKNWTEAGTYLIHITFGGITYEEDFVVDIDKQKDHQEKISCLKNGISEDLGKKLDIVTPNPYADSPDDRNVPTTNNLNRLKIAYGKSWKPSYEQVIMYPSQYEKVKNLNQDEREIAEPILQEIKNYLINYYSSRSEKIARDGEAMITQRKDLTIDDKAEIVYAIRQWKIDTQKYVPDAVQKFTLSYSSFIAGRELEENAIKKQQEQQLKIEKETQAIKEELQKKQSKNTESVKSIKTKEQLAKEKEDKIKKAKERAKQKAMEKAKQKAKSNSK